MMGAADDIMSVLVVPSSRSVRSRAAVLRYGRRLCCGCRLRWAVRARRAAAGRLNAGAAETPVALPWEDCWERDPCEPAGLVCPRVAEERPRARHNVSSPASLKWTGFSNAIRGLLGWVGAHGEKENGLSKGTVLRRRQRQNGEMAR